MGRAESPRWQPELPPGSHCDRCRPRHQLPSRDQARQRSLPRARLRRRWEVRGLRAIGQVPGKSGCCASPGHPLTLTLASHAPLQAARLRGDWPDAPGISRVYEASAVCEAGSPNVWGAEAKAGPVSATPASGSGRPGRRCLGEGCGPGHPPAPEGGHPCTRSGPSCAQGGAGSPAAPGRVRGQRALGAIAARVWLPRSPASGLPLASHPLGSPVTRSPVAARLAGRRSSGRTRTHPLPPLAGRLRWSGEGPASRKARGRKVGGPGSGAGLPGLWCRWRGDRSEPPSRRPTVAGRRGRVTPGALGAAQGVGCSRLMPLLHVYLLRLGAPRRQASWAPRPGDSWAQGPASRPTSQ